MQKEKGFALREAFFIWIYVSSLMLPAGRSSLGP